jgi:ornithine cyclodeaminase
MLMLSRTEIEALLDLDALIDALATAMANLSAGHASSPNRTAAMVDERDGMLAVMPAYVPANAALTTKLVSLFPQNAGTGLPTHQAIIAAFDPETGEPLALLDGTYITAMRTAACSALSARLLAREDASVLAILGTGVQARAHAQALPLVREFSEIRVWGRDRAKAQALASDIANARVADSAEAAVAGADVVCANTHAQEPVVRGQWLAPGTHVTSVGYTPSGRELDDATIAGAYVVVESRAATLAPPPAGSNDLTQPLAAGLLREGDVAELGEVLLGERPARTATDQLTVYKSVGVAVQDAAAAALVLAAARANRVGRQISLAT